ncbi:hypothetical protein [Pasteurella bettyae]|uniref:hypothetical protein n=1 Tax=Pasteurella bettyae TaxID=752 RepID=UPI003D2C6BCB
MNKLKLILLTSALVGLFSCTGSQNNQSGKVGYLKDNISQAELNNVTNYKKYNYVCKNFETASTSSLITYFPLSRESRMKDNFGFYFQLDGGKVEPFDHLENITLNPEGNRFEVRYRSYHQIQGGYVNLSAGERSSIYYKNTIPWLECNEI